MQAVILAAGQGTRLRPFTNECPKPLVGVQGKPMLHYQLEALDGAGVRECVIVVGWCADLIREAIGARFGNVAISYVENEIYDRTNNIYSLWLARRSIVDDILLLEGDLVFEPALLLDLLDTPYDNVAVVDRYDSTMNGTVIQAAATWQPPWCSRRTSPPISTTDPRSRRSTSTNSRVGRCAGR